jgi:hypothetical protein
MSLTDLLPAKPTDGPPLPRIMNIKWPVSGERLFPEPFQTTKEEIAGFKADQTPVERLKIALLLPHEFLIDLGLLPPTLIEKVIRKEK